MTDQLESMLRLCKGLKWSATTNRLRCLGHVLNLGVQAFLFARDEEAVDDASLIAQQSHQRLCETVGELSASKGQGWCAMPALQKLREFTTILRILWHYNAFKILRMVPFQCRLQEQLLSARSKIHLTTDSWTSPNKLEFQAVTCHFIDDEGILKKAVLCLSELLRGHAGSEVSHIILDTVQSFDLMDKVGYITSDNASANTSTNERRRCGVQPLVPLVITA